MTMYVALWQVWEVIWWCTETQSTEKIAIWFVTHVIRLAWTTSVTRASTGTFSESRRRWLSSASKEKSQYIWCYSFMSCSPSCHVALLVYIYIYIWSRVKIYTSLIWIVIMIVDIYTLNTRQNIQLNHWLRYSNVNRLKVWSIKTRS